MTDARGNFTRFACNEPKLAILTDHALTSQQASAVFEQDLFNFRYKLGPIYDLLRYDDPDSRDGASRMPMAVLISGGWGTGKTSAMRWLDGLLQEWNQQNPAKTRIHRVWFYPWKYDSREGVWRGLISEVIIASTQVKDLSWEDVRKAAKTFGLFLGKGFLHALASVKCTAKLPAGVEVETDFGCVKEILADYREIAHPEKAYLNEFENTLREWVVKTLHEKERMVVFIDDLDRCMPDIVLEVLEALKLYLNIPRLIFVVGVDKTIVERLIIDRYRKLGLIREGEEPEVEVARKQRRTDEDKARQYLSKMFQVEVELAPTEHQVKAFLVEQLAAIPSWKEKLSPPNSQLFNNIVLKLAGCNPREVKRFLNSALMVAVGSEMRSIDGKDDPYRFTQGLQDFCIRRILQKDHERIAEMIDTDNGRSFLTAWSKSVLKGVDTRPGEQEQDLRKQIDHDLGQVEEYREYLRLLSSDDLWALMQIPFSSELAEFTRRAGEQPQPATGAEALWPSTPSWLVEKGQGGISEEQMILQAAVAREVNKPPSELRPGDYERITKLDLSYSEVSNVDDLRRLKGLQSLALFGCRRLTSIEPLEALTNLEELDLRETPVDNLEPLQGLTGLQKLLFRGTLIDKLQPLGGLTNLRNLRLTGTRVEQLEPLAALTHLQDLDLTETQVHDLSPLSGLTQLQSLYLSGTNVNDLHALASLTDLRHLDLRGTSINDSSLKHLSSLANLNRLDLCQTSITDLAPVTSLKLLRVLYCEWTKVSRLEALRPLTGLQVLRLAKTPVIDLEPLSPLTGLRELRLAGTPVTNLKPLASLAALKVLYLEGTPVADIEPLTALTGLQELYLADTPITDLRPVVALAQLHHLEVNNTRIDDVKPLASLTELLHLDLRGTAVTNLVPLHSLQNLRRLYLDGARFSEPEIKQVATALPRLHIFT